MQAHTPEYPFEIISVDILGPYVITKNKNRYIIAAEDVFSKWIEAKAYNSVNGPTLLTFLEEEVKTRYGTPKQIISDNGGVFRSKAYEKFCQRNSIQIKNSAIYHQRANPIERRVQEIKKTLEP